MRGDGIKSVPRGLQIAVRFLTRLATGEPPACVTSK
jgi:hypothetical protein